MGKQGVGWTKGLGLGWGVNKYSINMKYNIIRRMLHTRISISISIFHLKKTVRTGEIDGEEAVD